MLSFRTKNIGFTLIEMAVIMVVLGLIISAVIPRLTKTVKREVFIEGKQMVRTAREEILGYAISHCSLPQNLDGIALTHVSGRWRSDLVYHVAPELAAGEDIDSITTTSLSVQTSSGITGDVAYIIASLGEDRGQDINFGTDPVEIKSMGEDDFDDVVEFVTLGHLQDKTDCGGTSEPEGPSNADTYVLSGLQGMSVPDSGNVDGSLNSQGYVNMQAFSRVTGDVYSGSDVTLQSQAVIEGSLVASGDVVLQSRAEVQGDIHAGGTVTLNSGSSTTLTTSVMGSIFAGEDVNTYSYTSVGGSVHAQEDVTIGYAGEVGGDVVADGDVTISGDAHITGNIYAGGSITLRWGAQVDGDLYYGGGLYNYSVRNIPGNRRHHGTPPVTPTPPDEYEPLVEPTPTSFGIGNTGTTAISTDDVTDQALAPGGYGSLTITNAKDGYWLTAGNYYFTSITTDWDWNLRLDTSGGDINVFVVGNVQINGVAEGGEDYACVFVRSTNGGPFEAMGTTADSNAAKVYFETKGAWNQGGTRAKWFGTIFSSGALTFGDNNQLIGSFYFGGNIQQSTSIIFTYVQSNYAREHW